MSYLGTEFLLGFYERYPDITLSTVDTSDNRALDVLLGGKADFAIVNGPIDHTRFQSEALFFSRYCFRIHRDNPLASKALLSPSDLDGQQIIGKGREYNCFRRNVDEIINTYALRLDIPLELSDEELLMDLVEHNVAIAGTYEFSALNHCGPNTVIRYLDAPVSGQMRLGKDTSSAADSIVSPEAGKKDAMLFALRPFSFVVCSRTSRKKYRNK